MVPDFNKFLQGVQSLTPEKIDMLSSQLAQNPQMVPPDFSGGGMGAMLQQMQNAPQGPQGIINPPGAVTSPLVQAQNPGAAPMPMAGGGGLGEMLAAQQGGMPNVAAMGPAQAPSGVSMEQIAAAQQALQGGGQGGGQSAPRAPYMGNVGWGAATPAQGLNLQAPMGSAPPGLADFLAKMQGR